MGVRFPPLLPRGEMNCEFCGKPGYWVVPELGRLLITSLDLGLTEPTQYKEHYACEEHRQLVGFKYKWSDGIHYDDTNNALPLKAILDPRGFREDVARRLRELRNELESMGGNDGPQLCSQPD